jgi:hypothetical protein
MDNLNTHNPGSLYEVFPPDKAKALWDRFEFVYTPKHGSWLNMAEIELHVLTGQCLNRRIDDIAIVRKEAAAWQKFRNNKHAKVNWQFTAEDARVKLSRLYPTLESWRDSRQEWKEIEANTFDDGTGKKFHFFLFNELVDELKGLRILESRVLQNIHPDIGRKSVLFVVTAKYIR